MAHPEKTGHEVHEKGGKGTNDELRRSAKGKEKAKNDTKRRKIKFQAAKEDDEVKQLMVKCGACMKVFETTDAFLEHRDNTQHGLAGEASSSKTVNAVRKNPLSKDKVPAQQSKVFRSKKALTQHCSSTGHNQAVPSKAKLEILATSTAAPSSFNCASCPKTFNSQQALTQHCTATHDSKTVPPKATRPIPAPSPQPVSPFTCTSCLKRFNSAQALAQHHTAKGHSQTAASKAVPKAAAASTPPLTPKPFQCITCPKAFPSARALFQHRTATRHDHHQNVPQPPSAPATKAPAPAPIIPLGQPIFYNCLSCPKKFKSRQAVINHCAALKHTHDQPMPLTNSQARNPLWFLDDDDNDDGDEVGAYFGRAYAGNFSGYISDEQDWILCDGECGWCGHCADGVDL
ncbi:hypothetical protein CC80DRAFT_495842 [Byssothecium circinans]|uniref:C2H2-type domain-containing protein n=1 Tax=Byssothecium circinans TaxID=147558 RepID=A0A6A5TH43_9PLEO|nr:hypothetical protein CC80DRAFT_495842 [Byssothecium circinans]